MSTLVGKQAPEFSAQAVMPDNSFKEIKLSDYKGKYVVLFFYPLDFTFVCPSEIIAFDHKLQEFKDRGVEVIGASVDSHFSHFAWKSTPVNKGGIGNVQFPLVADISKKISSDYGVLCPDNHIAFRGTFLIDQEGIVRHSVINDLSLGRNVDEAVRMVDALQHVEKYGEVCPAGWQKGEKAMTATTDGVAEYLAENSESL